MTKLKVINLFGGPGAGKSTLAAEVFAGLKRKGRSVELVTEVAKSFIYGEMWAFLDNQKFVLREQYKHIKRLENKVDIVVTDGPILLSCVYDKNNDEEILESSIRMHKEFNNWNIFVRRDRVYDQRGRGHTEEEAKLLDTSILHMLTSSNTPFESYFNSPSIRTPLVEMASQWCLRGDVPKPHTQIRHNID